MGRLRPRNPELGIVVELRQTLARLVDETHNQTLTPPRRRALEANIRATMTDLTRLLRELDPIRQPTAIFDPANPKIVGRFIALALVAQPRHSLAAIEPFYGSGVYAVYYNGSFPLYAPLSGSETPIYVGQAAPAVNNARNAEEQGNRLARRLEEHRRNIVRAAASLDIGDFEFRSLVVQSGWETAAEDYLIHLFRPIWNNETRLVFGLGKHGDAAETRGNRRSPWDTLHPGRVWAANQLLTDAKTPDQIEAELNAHLAEHPVFRDLDSLLRSFVEELRQV